jgi:hypothetical protein
MSDTPQQPIVLPAGSGPAATTSRPARPGDAAGSIVLLVLAFAAYLIGVILSFFGFLISGVCSSTSCNGPAGTTAQAVVAVTLAVVLLLGAGTSIALIVTRRRAIVVALVTLVLIVVGWVVGVIAFFLALSS